MKYAKGDLVEPTRVIEASYCNYGGRPALSFDPGMIGVVRHVDAASGAQVEFFSPATGDMEKCWTHSLRKVKWPADTKHPGREDGWWFCGSLHGLGALNYLSAIALLRPDYFKWLDACTLVIPGAHGCRGDRHGRYILNPKLAAEIEAAVRRLPSGDGESGELKRQIRMKG